jgi:hypothetical protein
MARDSAKGAGKVARKGKAKVMRENNMQRKRWPMMIGGLLVAGAAAGAAGAAIARRRANRSQWEEYGTTSSTSVREDAKAMADSGIDKVQSLADSAKDRAQEMMSGSKASQASTPSTSGSTGGTGSTSPSPSATTSTPDYSATGTASKNNRP